MSGRCGTAGPPVTPSLAPRLSQKAMPSFLQVLASPRKASRQSRPVSLWVPPLTWRLVTWQRMSFSGYRRRSGLCNVTQTLGRRTIIRLGNPMPTPGQELRALCLNAHRVPRDCICLHHAGQSCRAGSKCITGSRPCGGNSWHAYLTDSRIGICSNHYVTGIREPAMLVGMTEQDWAITLEVFDAVRSRRGQPGHNDRRFLEAVHFFTVHSITWRALATKTRRWSEVHGASTVLVSAHFR